jgi:hypothetical protein
VLMKEIQIPTKLKRGQLFIWVEVYKKIEAKTDSRKNKLTDFKFQGSKSTEVVCISTLLLMQFCPNGIYVASGTNELHKVFHGLGLRVPKTKLWTPHR